MICIDIIGEDEPTEENIEEKVSYPSEPYNVPNNEIDTPLDMQLFLVEPTAEKKFDWITKDVTLTYLDEEDLERARVIANIINTLKSFGLNKSAKMFMGDLANLLNTARSRHGFERQMQNTQIQKGFEYYDGQEENKKNKRR